MDYVSSIQEKKDEVEYGVMDHQNINDQEKNNLTSNDGDFKIDSHNATFSNQFLTKNWQCHSHVGKVLSSFIVPKRNKRKSPYSRYTRPRAKSTNYGHKTPLALLNECRPGLKVEVSDVTSDGNFTAFVCENGQKFVGVAPTKKLAKHKAAIHALRYFDPCALVGVMNKYAYGQIDSTDLVVEPIDFTSDDSWCQPFLFDDSPDTSEGSTTSNKQNQQNGKKFKLPKNFEDKNPLMVLNEAIPGKPKNFVCTDEKERSGTTIFTMKLIINEDTFTGEGTSKKQAKMVAAICALQQKFNLYHPAWQERFFPKDIYSSPSKIPNKEILGLQGPPVDKTPSSLSPISRFTKNPVMLLNEKIPGLQYTQKEECGKYDSNSFVIEVQVNGTTYKGYGKSKKQAKAGAAIRALREQYGIETTPVDQTVSKNTDQQIDTLGGLPDLIYTLVRDKFSSLTNNMQSETAKHKVLAGVVLTRQMDANVQEGKVISISTGTKCISGSSISNQGTVLLDCHAEIVCRRGLVKFIYEQLLNYKSDDPESIIEPSSSGRGYRMKNNVFFHLYINTTPCGDARIFSLREDEQHIDDHPNRKSRGQLRTKVEVGQGTIPVEAETLSREKYHYNVQQNWDAIIGGERLLTMSCSDKISKWNIVGAQGSLLSIFIEPVFFTSIVIGSLYNAEHVRRGLFERAKIATEIGLQKLKDSEQTVGAEKPLLASVSNPPKRQPSGKAPTLCLQWNEADQQIAMVNASTGQMEQSVPSQLCKKELVKKFLLLVKKKELIPRVDFDLSQGPYTYAEWKSKAAEYQVVKNALVKGFEASGCGNWVGKPTEVDMFIVE